MPTDELIGNPNHPVPKRIHNVVEKINAVPRDETVADLNGKIYKESCKEHPGGDEIKAFGSVELNLWKSHKICI